MVLKSLSSGSTWLKRSRPSVIFYYLSYFIVISSKSAHNLVWIILNYNKVISVYNESSLV